MTLNLDVVGRRFEAVERRWTSKDALLYSLGIGVGIDDPYRDLQFSTENSIGIDQAMLPTFPVLLIGPGIPLGDFPLSRVLHAAQSVQLLADLPVEGHAHVTGCVLEIQDKGEHAMVVMESDIESADRSRTLARTRSTIFIRGEGGFGGDRGKPDDWMAPDTAPDFIERFTTRPDQGLLYRLSGDRNPLHSDPEFAKTAGFDRPILHGLCTYGFTGRALLRTIGDDVSRFGMFEAQFRRPVYPGDELEVRIWEQTGGRKVFQTVVSGHVVLDRGVFEERGA
ncbi:MaoC/PaaZ C-terminal domain-containing protein [Nocardia sp. bgisy134]|uniref:MaoC family dehydratase n=1 Tax=Nocardia sp. bgisy134 TaxID=3413789 RepID=UPI003D70C5A0